MMLGLIVPTSGTVGSRAARSRPGGTEADFRDA